MIKSICVSIILLIILSGCSNDLTLEHKYTSVETCSDGIKNQDETEIDCNGICESCSTLTNITVSSKISQGSDDVEENTDGSLYITSSDIELVNDGERGDQTIGLRFNNINIPQGSVVNNAYIEFSANEINSDVTNLVINGEYVDNSLPFDTSMNAITSRTKTFSSILWNSVSEWNIKAEKHQTPNLISIIQEIVNRNGWTKGNSISIIISGTGKRTAEAFEGDAANAPILVVDFKGEPSLINKYIQSIPRHIHLTWKNGTATDTTMVVSWREKELNDDNSRVYYDNISKNCVLKEYNFNNVPIAINMHDTIESIKHSELTNLNPDSLYYFCINNSAGKSIEYSFKTAPSTGTGFTWLMGGDTKDSISIFETLSNHAMESEPLFIMYGGDAPNAGIDKDWSKWFNSIQKSFITPSGRMVPIIHTLANHELSKDSDASFWHDYYQYPNNELYYYHDIGDLRVLTLFSVGSEKLASIVSQATFIDSLLNDGQNKNMWMITQYHQPIYPTYRSPDSMTTKMKTYWLPLFDKYHLQLSSEAHDHTYKRTYPMFNDQITNIGNGTIYIGDGTWGEATRNVTSSNKWALENSEAYRPSVFVANIPNISFNSDDNSTWMNIVVIDEDNIEFDTLLVPKSS